MTLADRLARTDASEAKSVIAAQSLRHISHDIAFDDERDIKFRVHEELIEILGQQLYGDQVDIDVLEKHVFEASTKVLDAIDRPLSGLDRARMMQEVTDEILGLGPLQPLLRDPNISEIMVNRFDRIFVERDGNIFPSQLSFASEEHLRRTIDRIVSSVGRRVDESSPMVDARLADGSRVNAVVPPISLDGSSLTIRKFSEDAFTSRDLVATDTIPQNAMDVLAACVEGRLNIVISGGTGSGKTTTLNVLSSFIPDNERIITVEDAAELSLGQPHVVRLETRPSNTEDKGLVTIRDLVKNSLRMRPDRIVVGEVRDGAALDMLQAMNTGHDGSLTTVHANTTRDALSRIETMVLMAGMDLPVRAIREQITHAINIIVQQSRMRDGSRRITKISEITGLEGETIVMQDLYSFEYSDSSSRVEVGQLLPTGIMPEFLDRLAQRDVHLSGEYFRR
ncbi:MAG: CpaF family protein [Actinomycetes bacterium]|jgi:pilus assembly protein CpaF